MSLSTLSIRRPVFTIVINLVIVLFGIIGYTYLGVREFPSIDPAQISVRTSYAGANADIIESQITEPLEKAINSIDGIRNITSSSNQGSSNINIEFKLEKNLEEAANDVRDKVSQAVRLLPQDIDGLPTITKSDANSDAIISLTIQSNTRNQLELSDYAENVIAERLQTIPGVSTIQIWGQKKYAMRLWLDPAKLAAFRLTPLDVKNALDRESVELPSGKIEGNKTELIVKTVGRLVTEDDFNNLILTNSGDRTVRLRDIGYAVLGPEVEETNLKNNGVPMIGCGVVPQPGANYIDIADEFYKRVDQIQKELPKDYKLNFALVNTKFVRRSLTEVKETLLIAIILVILIIYLFFRDWIIAIRPLIDIPVSLIGAFFIMYLMGFTINVLSLLAIVLATGLVVDDGIVVTENIFKKVEKGMNKHKAALEGSKEIYFAVIATSITLAIVFLPIIFLEGFVGRLFREFGIVLAGAVLISAFVSLSLTPVLNIYMAKKNPHKHSWFYRVTEPFFVFHENLYRKSLEGFMRIRLPGLLFVLGGCIAIIVLIGKQLPSELAPMEDRNRIRTSITGPEGADFDFTDKVAYEITQQLLDSIPENSVSLTFAPGFGGGGSNAAFVSMGLIDASERKRSQDEIAQQMNRMFRKYNNLR